MMEHWNGSRFFNPWPDARPHGISGVFRWSVERLGKNRPRESRISSPSEPLVSVDQPGPDGLKITWVGHSSFLIQIGKLNFLTDPIWSERASPVQFLGPRRLQKPGIALDSLPRVDGILISHDHYDHLDRNTVIELNRRYPDARWFVPLRVGDWLLKRGVRYLEELDWDDSTECKGARITSIPAQHFSGRSLTTRDSTLWCGWIIKSGDIAVLFAGDTALHPEFERIGITYGPFNVAILPIGAYDPRWFMKPVHMNPEDAVDAFRALQSSDPQNRCVFVPSHWGTFALTDEPLDEPPNRLLASWKLAGFCMDRCTVLRAGESFSYPPRD